MKQRDAITGVELAYICHFQPEPEGGYTVTCPSLPPVVTYGETLDEARENAREAIELCLEVMKEEGHPKRPGPPLTPALSPLAGRGRAARAFNVRPLAPQAGRGTG